MFCLYKENVDELNIVSVVNGKQVLKCQVFVIMVDEFKIFLSYIKFDYLLFIQEYKYVFDIFFWGWNSDYIDIDLLFNFWYRIIDGFNEIDYLFFIDFREYKGYLSLLGYYFRYLFLMVKFVVYSDVIIDYIGKMKYLKILRVQLSNYE